MPDRRAMIPDVGTVLRQVARTALLCGLLGGLLYVAVAAVAGWPFGRWLMGLVLAAPLAILLGHLVLDALRQGFVPMRGGAVFREARPLAFWSTLAWFGACGMALAVLAAWCGIELQAALRAGG
jgi:hypothetical protein